MSECGGGSWHVSRVGGGVELGDERGWRGSVELGTEGGKSCEKRAKVGLLGILSGRRDLLFVMEGVGIGWRCSICAIFVPAA